MSVKAIGQYLRGIQDETTQKIGRALSDVGDGVNAASQAAAAAMAAVEYLAANLTVRIARGYAGAVTRVLDEKVGEQPSVLDFSGVGDGTTDNRFALEAALADVGARGAILRFPAGSYLVDNSAGAIHVEGFSGELRFDPGAELVFTDLAYGGLEFGDPNVDGSGGSNITITGLTARYSAQFDEGARIPAGTVEFSEASDIRISNVTIHTCPGMGLKFFQCSVIAINIARFYNTGKDGCHITNSQYATVTNLTAENTGDDSLSFVDYAGDDWGGNHSASNIIIKNCDTRGIAVVGPSNVTISNFVIDGTGAQGIVVGEDSFTVGQCSKNVFISNGVILNAGSVLPNTSPNCYGIYLTMASAGSLTDEIEVTIDNVVVRNAAKQGVFCDTYGGIKKVTLNRVVIENNVLGNGMEFVHRAIVRLSNCVVSGSPGYGIYFGNATLAALRNVEIRNVGTGGAVSNRALWFDSTAEIDVDGLSIVDTQATPTGYVVGENYGTAGRILNISSNITNGNLSMVRNTAAIYWSEWGGDKAQHRISTDRDQLLYIDRRGKLAFSLAVATAPTLDTGLNVLDAASVTLGPSVNNNSTGTILQVVQGDGTVKKVLYVTKNEHVLIGTNTDDEFCVLRANGNARFDGYVKLPSGLRIYGGTGSPEGVLSADPGWLYLSTSGALWVKSTAWSSTGWIQIGGGALVGESLTIDDDSPWIRLKKSGALKFEVDGDGNITDVGNVTMPDLTAYKPLKLDVDKKVVSAAINLTSADEVSFGSIADGSYLKRSGSAVGGVGAVALLGEIGAAASGHNHSGVYLEPNAIGGTYTSADGKTITVVNGQITSIV